MTEADLAHLEATGEACVLIEIARGAHGAEGSTMRAEVNAWLRSKRIVAEAAAFSKRDAREEETLAIAKSAAAAATTAALEAASANTISRSNRCISIASMIAAVVAAIAAIAATYVAIKGIK